MSDRPIVIRSDELPENEARYPAPWDTEPLASGRELGTEGERIGAWRDRIPPGRRTSRLHAHLHEEEAIYVLSGEPTLVWRAPGGPVERTGLASGDYVAFPGGTGIAHSVENHSDADAEVLVVGERHAADRLAYPEQPEFEAWRASRIPERCWPDFEGEPQGSGAPYRIETPNIVLRPFEPTDAWATVRAIRENQDRLKPWFPWAEQVPSVDEQLAWIRGRQAAYAQDEDYTMAVLNRSNALIGGTGLHPRHGPATIDIGYWVVATAEGKGWVTEWVTGLTRLALEVLGYEQVWIQCDVGNQRSRAIPERLGFERSGLVWDEGLGKEVDEYVLDALRGPSASATVRAWDALGRRLI